jgi:phosphate transport system protein
MRTYSPRETFDRQLQQLLDEVLVLGSMVEQLVIGAVDALKKRNREASQAIYASDQQINEKRHEIENECLTLIATQQPMARDLRFLAAILEIITELERIADYGKGIARINIRLGDEPLVKPLIDIPKMADKGLSMLRSSLEAFVQRDAVAARAIPIEDEEVDKLYNAVYHELLQIMINDPQTVDRATMLLWAAHNLERLADRVTNICERIIFVVTGEITELDQSDDEMHVPPNS